MTPRLEQKLKRIHANPTGHDFILADAKDADMCWGVASAGWVGRPDSGRYRTMPEFLEQTRAIVAQGIVDVMLGSVSTMSLLAHRERIFERSDVTPAVRINDTSDVWCPRGGKYRECASLPFATAYIEEAQFGSVAANGKDTPIVNLGLYSVTFNNEAVGDRETLLAFKEFRANARRRGFHYFLEVFAPNVDAHIPPEEVPAFVNDNICRMLAGVSLDDRPIFLKVPFFSPRALEELTAYDPSMIVGVMGGSSGTTYDAFRLLADAHKYGARVALYGRKIKDAEAPLAFIEFMRRIVDGEIGPREAVKAYHAELEHLHIEPRRALADDLKSTRTELSYRR
jgi:hypothetical protein